jgi:hypothetical protein
MASRFIGRTKLFLHIGLRDRRPDAGSSSIRRGVSVAWGAPYRGDAWTVTELSKWMITSIRLQ